MSASIVSHSARLSRYWWVARRSPNEWCGFLIDDRNPTNTRTEIGRRDQVLDAIRSQRQYVGLPIQISLAEAPRIDGGAA